MKTPNDIAQLVWDIVKDNPTWGRFRIANQLAVLRIFLAASTVRNILNRPRPRFEDSVSIEFVPDEHLLKQRLIPAFYPNHV
ncbi:MAG: hypothetical protein QNJ97_14785 [Myxococcota bacterium]|nr:hypothetical protein [Myxococcota bacterium]